MMRAYRKRYVLKPCGFTDFVVVLQLWFVRFDKTIHRIVQLTGIYHEVQLRSHHLAKTYHVRWFPQVCLWRRNTQYLALLTRMIGLRTSSGKSQNLQSSEIWLLEYIHFEVLTPWKCLDELWRLVDEVLEFYAQFFIHNRGEACWKADQLLFGSIMNTANIDKPSHSARAP